MLATRLNRLLSLTFSRSSGFRNILPQILHLLNMNITKTNFYFILKTQDFNVVVCGLSGVGLSNYKMLTCTPCLNVQQWLATPINMQNSLRFNWWKMADTERNELYKRAPIISMRNATVLCFCTHHSGVMWCSAHVRRYGDQLTTEKRHWEQWLFWEVQVKLGRRLKSRY